MARGQEVYSKIEPSFVLGRSEPGMRFRSMSARAQLCYLQLWNRAIEARTDAIPTPETSEIFKNFAQNLGYSRTVFERLLREICSKNFAKRVTPETCILLYVKDKHHGFRWKSSPNGERTGSKRGADGEQTGSKRVVEDRGKSNSTTPPTPHVGETPSADAGGGGGESWARALQKFPELGRVNPDAGSAALAGKNGSGAEWLAHLVLACRDTRVELPLSVVAHRLKSGAADPALVRACRAVLDPAPRARSKCPACGTGTIGEHYAPGSGQRAVVCDACNRKWVR